MSRFVDDVFDEYNKNKSGSMSYSETMKFIRHSTAECDDEKMEYTTVEVENCFKAINDDGCGMVDKRDMLRFMKEEMNEDGKDYALWDNDIFPEDEK